MRREKALYIALAAALISAPISLAEAAPKPIVLQTGSVLPAPAGSESFIQSGKNSIFISQTTTSTANITLTAIDLSGLQSWVTVLDSGGDEVSTASTLDPMGNIWLAGSASAPLLIETSTPIVGVDNPDGVIAIESTTSRSDMKNIALWKISPAGQLVATYLLPLQSVPYVTSLSATNSGASIIGNIAGKPFFVSASTSGVYEKLTYLGSSKTILNSVVRSPDGSSFIFGESSETLGGKKVAGLRDGVLLKVSKTGSISTVVRSSANGAKRSWVSSDTSLLLSGPVVSGKVIETAITKFTTKFAPTWTARYSSTGISLATTGGTNSYLAMTTKSAIPGVPMWKPSKAGLVILTFDSKGVLKAAHSFPGLVTPLNLQFSRERGLIGLGSASDGTVMIFTLAAR